MADAKDRGARVDGDPSHPFEALAGKVGIACAEHFIDDQDVGLDGRGRGKRQPGVHAGGIRLQRLVDETLQFGEIDDLSLLFADRARRQAW